MFYTKIGRGIAILAIIFGVLRVALGFAIATGVMIEPTPGRYLGTSSSGEAIDQGLYVVLFGIILGILTDISRSLAKRQE